MLTCPRCHQEVQSTAITCRHCGCVLKAHGHPGITLHRSEQGEFLCPTCSYELDDTCNFPQRPYATECTLYRNHLQKTDHDKATPKRLTFKVWVEKNVVWILLAVMALVALWLAIQSR
jgi:hypothetical protein